MRTTADIQEILIDNGCQRDAVAEIGILLHQLTPLQRDTFGRVLEAYPEYASVFMNLFERKKAAIQDQNTTAVEEIMSEEAVLFESAVAHGDSK